jgi:hypothetical protein
MTEEFRTLRDDEIEILMNAPAIVAVLIAGADDDIDKHEIKAAIDFAQQKKLTEGEGLAEYFEEIAKNFEAVQESYINDLPNGLEVRQTAISSYLRQLNGVLPKIDKEMAVKIYSFLTELAKVVATASGGTFGFAKVSKEEAAYMELDMIHNPNR